MATAAGSCDAHIAPTFLDQRVGAPSFGRGWVCCFLVFDSWSLAMRPSANATTTTQRVGASDFVAEVSHRRGLSAVGCLDRLLGFFHS